MTPIESHLASASGRLERYRGNIEAAFESSERIARELLRADAIDVLFIDSPDEAIPELGVGGYTYGPHIVIVAIDPDCPNLSEQHIFSTLIHEFHHVMRWRGPGCHGDLGDMIVSEGLAQLFEEEVTGVRPIYSQVPINSLEIEKAKLELYLPAFNQAKWFFGSEDITRWFGYAFGYQICATYAKSTMQRAADLAGVSTREVLEAADLH